MRRLPFLLSTLLALAASSPALSAPATPALAPVADHQQLVFSPAAAAFMTSATVDMRPVSAQDLIPQLDAAGVKRAALLSVA
jgi:hypothetical protein